MSLEEKILHEVVKSPIPVSIEYLAKKAGVGWGTALRYALELKATGKIQGVRTTTSWVFWSQKAEGGL